jgi:leucyl/phenylalanyl-tRNA--protein transferase
MAELALHFAHTFCAALSRLARFCGASSGKRALPGGLVVSTFGGSPPELSRQGSIRFRHFPGARMIPPDLLLHAYRSAVFPMAMEDGEIAWFSPDPRAIIPIEEFHAPHGLRRTLKSGKFEIRIDTEFEAVMRACAERSDTWINQEIVESYVELHRRGCAHSVEAWFEGRLAGGLYGVAIGGAFFGESMFHRVTDASKVALYALVERLRLRGFTLLDTQWLTPHLQTFGAFEVPRSVYRALLDSSLKRDCDFVNEP